MNKLEIANKALEYLRLDPLTSLNDELTDFYPYNCIEDLINEAITYVSYTQIWQSSCTDISLPFTTSVNLYSLADLADIDYNRVIQVYFIDTANLVYDLRRITFDSYKNTYFGKTQEGMPGFFAIEGDKLYIAPIPDKDYSLVLKYSKHIENLIEDTDSITIIPTRYQDPIVDYLIVNLSGMLEKNSFAENYKQFKRKLMQVKTSIDNYIDAPMSLPSNFGF